MKIKRGQILRDLRTSKKLNQSRLAELLGVSLTAYQKYEHGTAEPNFDNLSKLADFYGVSTDYLLGRTTVKRMTTEEIDPFELLGFGKSIDIDDDEFMRLYNTLPDFAKQLFVNIMTILAQATKQKEAKQQEAPQRPDIEISQNPQPFVKIARNGKRTILSDEEVKKLHELDDDEPPNLN